MYLNVAMVSGYRMLLAPNMTMGQTNLALFGWLILLGHQLGVPLTISGRAGTVRQGVPIGMVSLVHEQAIPVYVMIVNKS